MITTIFYPMVLKENNKWYFLHSPFFLTEQAAIDCARVACKNNGHKDFKTKSAQVVLNESGAIIS